MVNRLTGRQMDNHLIPIMPCSPLNTTGPVNPGRQVDRSTGKHVMISHNPLLSSYLPLDLSTMVDRLTGRQVNKYGLPIIPCFPIFTSDPVNPFIVHLSTCPPRLTDPGKI